MAKKPPKKHSQRDATKSVVKKPAEKGTKAAPSSRPRKEAKPAKIIIAVSGGFDPVHIGHVRMFKEAKKLGGDTGELVVILNNDNWLRAKKGYAFMHQEERKEIIESFECVDRVVITAHPEDPSDMSVCDELIAIRPHIFANGGDRTNRNVPEIPVCNEIGCEMIYNIGEGGKVQSSSWLVDRAKGRLNRNR